MKSFLYASFLVLIIATSFLAGLWLNRHSDLQVPVSYTERGPSAAEEEDEDDTVFEEGRAPGSVKISPDRQQLIGVKVEVVRKEPVVHTLRVLGRVEADETFIYRINASADGWIQKTYPNPVGSLVQKGEVLATFSTPQFADTVQNFFYAMETAERLEVNKRQLVHRREEVARGTDDRFILQRQIDLLRGMGVDPSQIEEIKGTRRISPDIRITSPATGFITARKVSPGERFEKGTELFRITDLSRVWILADVFEGETRHFQAGSKVMVHLPRSHKTFPATVSRILPIFDAATRTLKVRLEADNPNYMLRPDMFVDLELPVSMPPALAVPADAVLHSGLRRTVFVERGGGYFEPRRVETGWRMGDRIEIVRGLAPGDRIVVAGNFFVNSESRLQAAAQGIYGEVSLDPVCGTEADETRARASGNTGEHQGRTYYFCSAECKAAFDKDPGLFVNKSDPPERDDRHSTGNP